MILYPKPKLITKKTLETLSMVKKNSFYRYWLYSSNLSST